MGIMRLMRAKQMIRDLSAREQTALQLLLIKNMDLRQFGIGVFDTVEMLELIAELEGGRDPEAFLNEWIGRMRAQTQPEPTRTESGPGPSANAGQRSNRQRLAELDELHAMGTISADEYDLKRQQVIDSI